MRGILLIGALLVSFSSQAQFWFGPTVGGQLIFPKYVTELQSDSFKVSPRVDFQIGVSGDYTTEGMFEVHTELVYMRVNNRARSTDLFESSPGGYRVDSKTVNHFLSVPIMARIVFMKKRIFKVTASMGPRISYWLGGKGTLESDNLLEHDSNPLNYKVEFSKMDLNDVINNESDFEGKFVVTNPNRLQYGIDFGVGFMFDVTPKQRAFVDAKYSWGHSFYAFNEGNHLVGGQDYAEDTEYRSNMFTISVSYVFGFSELYVKQGKSSSSLGKKKKKKR